MPSQNTPEDEGDYCWTDEWLDATQPPAITPRFIAIDPIRELLKAGRIVGLDPREMTAIALDELRREEADAAR